MPKTPPIGFNNNFHMNTMPPPLSMPAIAPALVTRFQNKENSIIGPKVAPKPAQAKETTMNITLFSSMAMIMEQIAIIIKVILVQYRTVLSEASFLNIPWKMFLEKADAAISKYESEELIVAAKIPAITIPAIKGMKKLVESRMKIFSAEL